MKLTEFCEKCQKVLSCHWKKIEDDDEADKRHHRRYISNVICWYRAFEGRDERTQLDFYTSSELENCDDRHCQLCKLWQSNFGTFSTYHSEHLNHIAGEISLSHHTDDTYDLWIRYPHGGIRIKCLTSAINPLEEDLTSQQNRSREVYSQIKVWLDECRLRHNECQQWSRYGLESSSTAQQPARLLFIDPDTDSIRLISRADFPADLQYTTLSHCWGDFVPVRLTRETLANLIGGYPCCSLPPTFRDAVYVTQILGISFIWIDALCIIQDLSEDWQTEAPKMAYVYSQGFVNLAATGSNDSSGGLLCQTPDFLSSYHEVETTWSEPKLQVISLEPNRSWHDFICDAPLNTRAWVLQERALAPRTIHFASDKIWWQCQEISCHEVRPKGLEINENRDPAFLIRKAKWELLIGLYSQLSLSRKSDKLMAIAGIARVYASLHGLSKDDYLAGLWKSDFPRQLLWLFMEPGKPSELKVPSWSWAFNDGEVTPCKTLYRPDAFLCKLIEIEMRPESANVSFAASDGILHIEGCILPLRMTYRILDLSHRREAQYIHFGRLTEFLLTVDNEVELATQNRIECAAMHLDRTDTEVSIGSNDIWFLPLKWQEAMLYWPDMPRRDWAMEVEGLLIRKDDDSPNGLFKRVGHLMVHRDKSRWDLNFWSTCSLEDNRLYTKDLGNGRYHFKLN